jgi:hypothetical protein
MQIQVNATQLPLPDSLEWVMLTYDEILHHCISPGQNILTASKYPGFDPERSGFGLCFITMLTGSLLVSRCPLG